MAKENFSLVNHIWQYDDLLDYRVVTNLISYLNKIDKQNYFKDAQIIGKEKEHLNKEIRNTKNFALTNLNESKTDQHWCNLLLATFRKALNKYTQAYLPGIAIQDVIDIQALKYVGGGHYVPHVDDHFDIPRTVSMIYRLNNDFKGGDLVFSLQGNEMLRLKPKPNSLIVWPSNFLYPHSVEPVTKGMRWSIVAWAR